MVVFGDVNSTLAAPWPPRSSVIPVAHVEAGFAASTDDARGAQPHRHRPALRRCSSSHSPEARENLLREGVAAERDPPRRQHHDRHARSASRRWRALDEPWRQLGLVPGRVRARDAAPPGERRRRRCSLGTAVALGRLGTQVPIVFPVHPRTRARMSRSDVANVSRVERCLLAGPLGYLDFLASGRGADCAHRLGRHPGGDDRARRSLPHAPRQHRAADHGRARDEHAAGRGPERIAEIPALLDPAAALRGDPALGREGGRTGGAPSSRTSSQLRAELSLQEIDACSQMVRTGVGSPEATPQGHPLPPGPQTTT